MKLSLVPSFIVLWLRQTCTDGCIPGERSSLRASGPSVPPSLLPSLRPSLPPSFLTLKRVPMMSEAL